MTTLGEVRETVATTIGAAFAASFAEVGVIDGAVTLAELLRRTPRLPALLLNTPRDRSVGSIGGSPMIRIDFEAYVVVQSTSIAARGRAMLDLSGGVRQWLAAMKPTFGLASTTPDEVKRSSLYSTVLDQAGAAVAVVTWSQDFRFGDHDPTLVNLERINFSFTLDGDGAPIVDDVYPEIAP